MRRNVVGEMERGGSVLGQLSLSRDIGSLPVEWILTEEMADLLTKERVDNLALTVFPLTSSLHFPSSYPSDHSDPLIFFSVFFNCHH